MATVARLLPRFWDGRRLLQFLTGLALIALAFAVPALWQPAGQPAEPPVTVVTTVDTPLSPGLPVIEAPARAGDGQPGLAMDPDAVVTDQTGVKAEAAAAGRVAGAAAPSGLPGPADLTVQAGDADQGICVEARTAVSGITQRAHGERGPPRA